MATGQQQSFSWKSVAVSAISAPVISAINGQIKDSEWAKANPNLGIIATSTATSVTSAVTRMAVVGGRVSWGAVAADAIGNALGSSLRELMQPASDRPQEPKLQTNSSASLRAAGLRLPTGTRFLDQPDGLNGVIDLQLDGGPSAVPQGDPSDLKLGTMDRVTARSMVGEGRVEPETDTFAAHRARLNDIFAETSNSSEADYTEGRRILRSYGFRTGALEAELANQTLTVDQKAELLRGEGTAALPYARASVRLFNDAPSAELAERAALFGNGNITRTSADGEDRTISFAFDANAATLSRGVGVSVEEARAKTSWAVYSSVIDAAFETEGLNSVRFNGLWRPTHQFFTSYFANSQAAAFAGMSSQQRTAAANAVKAAAGITAGQAWSPQHTLGNSVDIDRVNGTAVHNGVTQLNQAIVTQQSALIGRFTDRLASQTHTGLYTPWRIYTNGTANFGGNVSTSGLHYNHRNHIHFGI